MSSFDVSFISMHGVRARRTQPPMAPVPSVVQTLAFWRDPHAYLEWCRHRYGDTFAIDPVGKPPLVFLSRSSDIQTVVKAPADILHPGAGGVVIAPLVGAGSFMIAEEDEHLAGRRNILPAFHQRFINEHAHMVRETAERETTTWPSATPIALHGQLRALTLRVILLSIFEHEDRRVRELHARLLAMFAVTGGLALQERQLRRLPRWRCIWKRFLADRLEVDHIITDLIRREAHARSRDSGVLAMLLGSQHFEESDTGIEQIRDTLMSLILAGHETTAAELAWAFQLLAHNPTVMRRLVDDLDDGGERYLTAVIHEVLRHRPVFLFTIPRAVRQAFEVSATIYHPPNHLVGCVHLMHHDPDLYPEPHTFKPERFLQAAPNPEIWMPWGGGRKRCPGHRLALLEMRVVLDAVLSRFEVAPARRRLETARWRSVIVTPGDGCRVVLRRRAVARRADSTPSGDSQRGHS
jgi:cytochrome P450